MNFTVMDIVAAFAINTLIKEVLVMFPSLFPFWYFFKSIWEMNTSQTTTKTSNKALQFILLHCLNLRLNAFFVCQKGKAGVLILKKPP